jgi:lipopolysaccharide biosynthesis regulator YciM
MGTLREAQGNAADAKLWFEKAAAADAMWTRPLMKLASIASSAGDRATATRHLTRVVDLDPASTDGKQAAELLKTP